MHRVFSVCFLFSLQFDKMLVNKCAGQRVEHTKNEGHIISKMIFIVKFKNRVSKCKMLVRLTALTKQTCNLKVHGREMISFSSFNSYTLFFFASHFSVFLSIWFIACLCHSEIQKKMTFRSLLLLCYFARAMCNSIVGWSVTLRFDRTPYSLVSYSGAECTRVYLFLSILFSFLLIMHSFWSS